MATGIINPHALAPSFSPEEFPFKHLYWAGGPNMLAKSYADGDPVPSWPCEITGNSIDDLVPEGGYSSSRFLYKDAGVNGNQSVFFTSTSHMGMRLVTRWSDYAAMNSVNYSPGSAQAIVTCSQQVSPSSTAMSGIMHLYTDAQGAGGAARAPQLNMRAGASASNTKISSATSSGNSAYVDTLGGSRYSPFVTFYDATSPDPTPTPNTVYRTGDMFWTNGAAVGNYASTYANAWTYSKGFAWGYWGVGGRAIDQVYNLRNTHVSFVGIYADSTVLMRDQPKFAALNTWFNNEYGVDIIT